MKKVFFDTALIIADEIIERAVKNKSGWHWIYHDHNGRQIDSNSLYAGNSGTIFFLMEVYNVCSEEKYLTAIRHSLSWLMIEGNIDNEKNLAFYCGLGGIVQVMIEGYRITEDEIYLKFAKKIVKDNITKNRNCDILYGTAGEIVTLLYFLNEINEKWVLDAIETKIEELIDCTIFTKEGACWERGGGTIRSLCGFAHGASGIAHVFIELYNFFGNYIFLKIAEMAFRYEDTYFDPHQNNWPDFRKDIYSHEKVNALINMYNKNDMQNLLDYSFMNAWCHGAPGIGMARCNAFYVANMKSQSKYVEHALSSVCNALTIDTNNFTYCHGLLGNASLLIDAYIWSNDESLLNRVHQVGKRAIYEMENNGKFISGITKHGAEADCDLLNGIAGIGHFFLRIAFPKIVKPILAPIIHKKAHTIYALNRFDKSYLVSVMYKNIFQNVASNVSEIDINFSTKLENLSREYMSNRIKKYINTSGNDNFKNAFELDNRKLEIADNLASNNYLYIKEIVESNLNSKSNIHLLRLVEILSCEFCLNNTVHLLKQVLSNRTEYVLLKISADGPAIAQSYISEYLYDLLTTFKESNSINDSLKAIIQKYYRKEQSALQFCKIYTENCMECINANLIVRKAL